MTYEIPAEGYIASTGMYSPFPFGSIYIGMIVPESGASSSVIVVEDS